MRRLLIVPTVVLFSLPLISCGPGGEQAVPSVSISHPGTLGTARIGEVIAQDLRVPWGMAVLNNGSALVGERNSGRVLLVDGASVAEVGSVEVAKDTSEGGLLGIAVSPKDESEVFVYYTSPKDNRIARFDFDGSKLSGGEVILSGIPRASNHNGGRMAFGPDGYLYVGTGDAAERPNSQNKESLAGKILRIDTSGKPAPDNPFGNEVYSLGHRNVQGLAFDADGRLWASEFGQNRLDEINLIVSGGNYGWPEVEGVGDNDKFVNPLVTWATSEASPSGIAIVGDVLVVAALRGQRLWVVPLDGESAGEPKSFFTGQLGRLRTVVAAGDNKVWLTTSNHDGRGDPNAGDDQIIEIVFDQQ